MELAAIESGAEDLRWQTVGEKESLEVITKAGDLENVRKKLEERGLSIEYSGLEWIAKEETSVGEKEKNGIEKLLIELQDNEAVQGVYYNLPESEFGE